MPQAGPGGPAICNSLNPCFIIVATCTACRLVFPLYGYIAQTVSGIDRVLRTLVAESGRVDWLMIADEMSGCNWRNMLINESLWR